MADNVIKKVVDMRKGKTAILPSIVTNPELTGEEESLKSVEINGQKYTIGGGQLKLVATGTYDEEKTTETSEAFNLDNILEPNKIYLLEYYNNDYGVKSVTYFKTKQENEDIKTDFKGTFTLPNEDYEIVLGGMEYLYMFNGETETFDNYIKVFSYNNNIASGSEDYINVYELPLSFGESSGGSGKFYQHNVCLYISNSNVELEVYITLYSTKGDVYGSIEEIIGDNKVYHLPCEIVDCNGNPNNYAGIISITKYYIKILGSPIGIDNDHEDNFQYIVDGKENVSQVEIYFDEYIYEV